MKPNKRLRVGDWFYLPERDHLVQFNDDGQIEIIADLDHLSQKLMNYFMLNPGKLLTTQELLEEVWGMRNVSDGRVTRVIGVLRAALGDDAINPKYIENMPKRGYRLIAPVTEVDVTTSTRPRPITLTSLLILVPIFLAAGLLVSNYVSTSEETQSNAPLWRFEPLTFLDGLEFYHSLSPDEELLAFSYASSPSDNVALLKLQNLTTHQVIQLTEPPYSSFGAAWNPDGTKLAYHRMLSGRLCEIRLLTLTDDRMGVANDRLLTLCGKESVSARLDWSPDGKHLLYPSRMDGQRQMTLMQFSLEGRTSEVLTAPPSSGFGDYTGRYSKDGSKLVYLRDNNAGVQIRVMDLSTRSSRLLAQLNNISPGNIDWCLDNSEIVYPAGNHTLGVINVHTGKHRILAYTDQNPVEVQVSSSGRIIASVGAFSQQNVLRVPNDIVNKTERTSQIVFQSNRSESFAHASPVSNGPVAVVSMRSGISQIYFFYPDGSQKQLTNFNEHSRISQLSFSKDGLYLLPLINQRLWIFSETSEPIIIPTPAGQNLNNPHWGQDGKSIYYSVLHQGRWQVMRTSLENPALSTVFNDQMEFYMESPGGQYRLWQWNHNRHFYLQHTDQGVPKRLDLQVQDSSPVQFELTDEGLYYSTHIRDNHYQLFYLDFGNNQVRAATGLDAMSSSRFSLSHDHQFFYVPSRGRGELDIAEISLAQQGIKPPTR